MARARVVCVLGMHRSGTSVVSRMLGLLGADLGPERNRMKPRSDNPKGFWEHQLLVTINDEILARFGGSWDKPPSFPDAWATSPDLADLRQRADDVIRKDFGGARLWSWKDPRTCLTLPFWQQLVPSMRYVVCLRNPADVARSLERRDGFPIETGGKLWLAYTASAFRSISGQPRLLVFHEDMMRDPETEVKRLAAFLDAPDLADQTNLQRGIREFLEEDLYHHRTCVSQSVNEPALAFPVKSLYLALRALHAQSLNQEIQADLDGALDHFSARAQEQLVAQDHDAALLADLRTKLGESEQRAQELSAERNGLREQLGSAEARVLTLDQTVDALNAQFSKARAERENIAADRDRLAVVASQRRAELQLQAVQADVMSSALKNRDNLIGDLQGQLTESRALVQRIERSLSWRMTAPLRAIVARARPARRLLMLSHTLSTMLRGSGLSAYRVVAWSSLFDRAYYLQKCPDVARSWIPAIIHYLAFGWREGRDPHPLFDTDWYLNQNPDVVASGMNPLAHYVSFGAKEGRDPHPLFDTDWYLRRNPDVAGSGMNALAHFARFGATEGRDPHPLFDTDWYLRQNPDVAASGVNTLAHYVFFGAAEGRSPHPLFDGNWYLKQYRDVAAAGINPLEHYLNFGAVDSRDPNPLFDSAWYLEKNPDVRQAGLNPLAHFVERGSLERRDPSSRFSCRDYLEANPDVEQLGTCPLEHYLQVGIRQRRPLRKETRRLSRVGLPSRTRRIVMIDVIYPRPDRDAGSVIAVNLVKAVLRLGYSLSFIATSEFSKQSPYKNALRDMGADVIDDLSWSSVEEFVRAEGAGVSAFILARWHSGGHYFELVHANAPRSKIIFNTVDLHAVREQREATVRNDRRALNHAMRTWERELYLARLADVTIVVSAAEAVLLREQAPGANIVELPLIQEFHGRTLGFDERSGIGFVGGFQHPPNPDAVRFFLADVWPAIRQRKPDVVFQVIGPDIPPDIVTRSDPGLVVVGHVPDLAAALGKVRMTVAPLRFGAGSKGKIVSSLSIGVPCVATPVATEGMGLVDGETILIGRSAHEFAEQVLRLYDDERLWYRLSDNGLDMFMKQHSFDVGVNRIARILSGIGLAVDEIEANVAAAP